MHAYKMHAYEIHAREIHCSGENALSFLGANPRLYGARVRTHQITPRNLGFGSLILPGLA